MNRPQDTHREARIMSGICGPAVLLTLLLVAMAALVWCGMSLLA